MLSLIDVLGEGNVLMFDIIALELLLQHLLYSLYIKTILKIPYSIYNFERGAAMLVYFLANSGERMNNVDINLDARFSIHYDAISKSLNISRNENYLKDYWGANISSVTAIVGENGVGKTSVLKLIKDRFVWGFNHPESTILIFQTNNQYEMFYDEGLFQSENEVTINGYTHNIEHSLLYKEVNTYIIQIDELGIDLAVRKISKSEKEKINDRVDIQINTRIGRDTSLVFHTNNWNYTRVDRASNENIQAKELDYFDYSIGNRIDQIFQKQSEYIPEIANLSDIYTIVKDTRFEVDYLFKLQEDEMIRTLTYFDDPTNFKLLSEYFNVPEEIYIFFDFMDSKSRNHPFAMGKDYLRFENQDENFVSENVIYNYLFKNIRQGIEVKEALALSIIERLFMDINLMVASKTIKSKVIEIESKQQFEVLKDMDILEALINNKNAFLKAIDEEKINEVFTKKEKDALLSKVEQMMTSYSEFLEYILNNFSNKTDKRKREGNSLFIVNELSSSIQSVDIELPVIKMDKEGIAVARTFFEQYAKLKSKNKPLYFAWRDLSAGESQLLTLLTSLNMAIQEARHVDVIILLDEVEISLHPSWQRNLIKLLAENLNAKAEMEGKRVQVILATHSPFILSDLPFNSMILLDKNEQGQVIVQNELDGQVATLGANIHELYAHSFFLKGGLIGDYAKQKINEVANQLIKADATQTIDWEGTRKFINQIGEPIIKARLVELYDQKYKLHKPSEVESVKEEIEALKKRLKMLEQRKDES